jgi:hypothetical protein
MASDRWPDCLSDAELLDELRRKCSACFDGHGGAGRRTMDDFDVCWQVAGERGLDGERQRIFDEVKAARAQKQKEQMDVAKTLGATREGTK